jgi:uncharacterized cupin superfamily protein
MTDTAIPVALVVADARTLDLGAPAPKRTSLTGQSEAAASVHETATLDAGVWECEPGEFTAAHLADTEVCHILAGRATVTGDDGVSAEVATGSLLVLPKGWTGRWVVHEHIRKTYVVVSH